MAASAPAEDPISESTTPTAARRKFEAGPAAETARFASRGFRVLRRSTGVGLALAEKEPGEEIEERRQQDAPEGIDVADAG